MKRSVSVMQPIIEIWKLISENTLKVFKIKKTRRRVTEFFSNLDENYPSSEKQTIRKALFVRWDLKESIELISSK